MQPNAQLRVNAMPHPGLVTWTRGSSANVRLSSYVLTGLLLLLLLISLRCTHFLNPTAEYSRVRKLFERGYLSDSQDAAADGYRRFLNTRPDWASQFLLLEAESMIWRGFNEESLRLLSAQPSTFFSPEGIIQKLTLEAVALTHLDRLPAAEQRVADSSVLCNVRAYASCVGVVRAQGILALEQDHLAEARNYFLKSLSLARAQHDRITETTVLLYLGEVSSYNERYDEELDWTNSAYRLAVESGEEDLAQVASGGLGWSYFKLGDKERALDLFLEAERRAAKLGDTVFEIKWLRTLGMVYLESGKLDLARTAYQTAFELADRNHSQQDMTAALIVLAQIALAGGDLASADGYANQAMARAQESGDRNDRADVLAIQLQTAALRGDKALAEQLLNEVEAAPESQTSMKWASERAMANLYENRGEMAALNAYQSALKTFESARAEIQNEDSRLPFLTNATHIYDDYIHFLVNRGRTDEALAAADQSRARTLAQGLGLAANKSDFKSAPLHPSAVAKKCGATVLFYWLGEKQSYLWVIGPKQTKLIALPAQAEISQQVERYRNALQEPNLGLGSTNDKGIALYRMLVAPAAELIPHDGNVVVVSDGPLSLLNFETLVVPGPSPHYWIEDANIVSAPSLHMLASAKASHDTGRKLLLLGDAVSPNPDYPELPMASVEMRQIEKHFTAQDETVFARHSATSNAYLKSELKDYSYIHFVAHGVASRLDPLDSAIILSRTGEAEDSFKLHARDIIQHPIDARLVTISACYGGGTRSYAGEGLVGLSWAFLRAGAHNVIGALWEASDDSTPQLMGSLYEGLERGETPSAALRQAKLMLLHSKGRFSEPFYWAPFQIYAGL